MNDYDQAAHYTAKLNPMGFLRWLIPGIDSRLIFRDWLDTRTLPFPGEPDRTCDTVAALTGGPNRHYVMVIEFQSYPHRLMMARLLEYLSRLNLELTVSRHSFQVVAGLVNLTGRARSSRLEMRLPGEGEASLTLQVATKTLAEEDASATLAAIATGELDRCILPWVP